jgi:hypothetical protein
MPAISISVNDQAYAVLHKASDFVSLTRYQLTAVANHVAVRVHVMAFTSP